MHGGTMTRSAMALALFGQMHLAASSQQQHADLMRASGACVPWVRAARIDLH